MYAECVIDAGVVAITAAVDRLRLGCLGGRKLGESLTPEKVGLPLFGICGAEGGTREGGEQLAADVVEKLLHSVRDTFSVWQHPPAIVLVCFV